MMVTRRNFIKVTAAGSALAAFGQMTDAKSTVLSAVSGVSGTTYVTEEEKQIPVIAEVDLIVVGGTSAAIAAAGAASRSGSKVFLVAPLSYLGDDICGSFRFVCDKGESPVNALGRRLFLESKSPTPLYIKTELENELIDNDVDFLYSSYVTNVIAGRGGRLAGVVITNRSGRQAIRCKAIIDATHRASVARVALAEMTLFKAGTYDFGFVTVGNTPLKGAEITEVEEVPYSVVVGNKKLPVTRYNLRLPVKDDSYATIQELEQVIRDKTWTPDQGDSSDVLEYVPFNSIVSAHPFPQAFSSVRQIPLDACRPKGIENLWIAGPSADISREMAKGVMRPVRAIAWGEIVGERVAGLIAGQPLPEAVAVLTVTEKGEDRGKVGELLLPLRQNRAKGFVTSPKSALPVFGTYDVVILGGGTAGAPAGISAARQGAKTLVLEYLHGLGGMMTLGLIGRYWDGFRGGFSSEVDEGVRGMAPSDHPRQMKDWKNNHLSDWKQEFFRQELRKAGGELWFGVLGCGTLVRDGQVTGVVVSTPYGRGIIRAKVIIDSTGSADLAIAAGANYNYTGEHVAVQGAGMGSWTPFDYYNNNDWAFIDDTDILDISRIYVQAKKKHTGKYDMVKIPQTRERRRVVGEYSVSVYDVLNHRRHPDTISYHKSSFDTHGMIVDPYFILCPPEKRHAIYDADVPLRSLLPAGLEGILTTGLGISADRDAMPVIRMQSCLQNQGYAVGYLAALAVRENKPIRKVDIKKVQKFLVSIGNLPERVLMDKTFKGYTDKEMQAAADTLKDNYKGFEILLTDPSKCIRLVDEKMNRATDAKERIIYASIHCMLGNKKYASVLAEEIKNHSSWDTGWNYTGSGQFGTCMSRLDALLIALGNAKDSAYLPVVTEKAELLTPVDYFSHFRAVAVATEMMGSREAAPVLYEMLRTPGMRYYHIDSYRDARRKTVPYEHDVSVRNAALKELHLARALYCCGDKDLLGETVLRHYADGLQGHYARYASTLLSNKG